MATVNLIQSKRSQSRAGLAFILSYCKRENKTMHSGKKLTGGINCVAESAYHEMMSTKMRYEKTDGRMFYKIGEEVLDELIFKELKELKIMAHENFEKIDRELKNWLADRPSAEKQITALKDKLAQRKTDQQQILLERIRDREHAAVYTEMLIACESDIKTIENRIQEMNNIENTVKERKKQMKKSVELLDGIIADGAISDTHLRMLVDEIVIHEKNGKLDVQITLNGEFRTHIDYYDESGDITDRHAEIWYFPNWESMAEG